jgi:hypothetical protein
MVGVLVWLLIMFVIFSFQPFITAELIPSAVRVPAIFFLVICSFFVAIKKRNIFYFTILFIFISIALFYNWQGNSPKTISNIIYVLMLIAFTVYFGVSINKLPGLATILIQFWIGMLVFISLSSILSFICFNFHLLPYSNAKIGNYVYDFNPLLGYINPKAFGRGLIIGRSCHFMLEPSYLACYLTINYFLIDSFSLEGLKRKGLKIIVFLAGMSTFSTSVWIVFGLVFILSILYKVFKKFRLEERLSRFVLFSFLGLLAIGVAFIPKDKIVDFLGKSSFSDRSNRMEAGFLIIASTDVKDLLFGNGPGYIASNYSKGESNQYVKMFIEEGALVSLIVLIYVIWLARSNFNFLLAVLIFLNSVVILWTPLFIVNLILCQVLYKRDELSLSLDEKLLDP